MEKKCEGTSEGVSGDSLDEDAGRISDIEYGIWKDKERLKTAGMRLKVGSDVPAGRVECGPLREQALPGKKISNWNHD